MLEILGTIAGNILSLPGIVGLALGMMTRNIVVAAVLGAGIGAFETFIFAGGSFAAAEPMELAIAIGVGILFACLGCLIRLKGATV